VQHQSQRWLRPVLFLTLVASFNTSPHHSLAPYDLSNATTISGTVTQFEFVNPHGSISVDAERENGVAEHWIVTIESATQLRRHGWSKDTLRPGENIRVLGNRAKDGSWHMRGVSIEFRRDGKVVTLSGLT
jgi:hypothetical protein